LKSLVLVALVQVTGLHLFDMPREAEAAAIQGLAIKPYLDRCRMSLAQEGRRLPEQQMA
jgi:hypothetical protein